MTTMKSYGDDTIQQQQDLLGMSSSFHPNNNMAFSAQYNNNMRIIQLLQQQQQQQRQRPQSNDASFYLQQDVEQSPPSTMNNLGTFQPAHLSRQDSQNVVEQHPSTGFAFTNNIHNASLNIHLHNGNHVQNAGSVRETVPQAAFLAQTRDFQDSNEQHYNHHHQQQDNAAIFASSENAGNNVSDEDDNGAGSNRFRHYQADSWSKMLEKLVEFRGAHGHANVAHTSKDYPELGRWVKRQRYQYKLMKEGKKESTMTPERAQVLEQVGFVWDAHSSTWHRRFQELHAYYLLNGNCNVPSSYPANPQLSTWVKFQRRQYKAVKNGRTQKVGGASGQSLTPVRIRALEELGFQWELRKSRSLKK